MTRGNPDEEEEEEEDSDTDDIDHNGEKTNPSHQFIHFKKHKNTVKNRKNKYKYVVKNQKEIFFYFFLATEESKESDAFGNFLTERKEVVQVRNKKSAMSEGP